VAEGGGGEQSTGAGSGTHDIFISYASPNSAVADAVAAALERHGRKCWMAPRDVTPGAHYASEIVHAIDSAKAIVLILSQDAATSPHVLREIERATSKRHPIVTVRVDQAPLPAEFEYFLNTSQWLDASGGDATRMMPKLVEAVKSALKAPAATPAAALTSHAPAHSASARSPKRTAIVVTSLIGLALAGFAADRLWLSSHRTASTPASTKLASAPAPAASTIPEKSIAVLPFTDMSEKKDQEYFADGMAEELADILARIPQLKVIGRTSSFRFRGHTGDLHAVGEQLGAAYVVEGSVRRGGSRIRVTAQLFDTRSSTQLWADSYDREFGDVLALQSQLASSIARALQLVVAADDTQPLRQLQSPEAYTLYLRGLAAYDRGEDGLSEAQANFEQVLALEPTYSRAAEALALTHLGLIGDNVVPSGIGWPHAVKAAKLALSLDPKSAFAHVILGLKLATYDYDWAGAAKELEAAVAAKSRDPVVLYNSAWLAFDVGRFEDAVHLEDASLSLDPLNPDSLQNGAIIHYLLGHLDLAERAFRKSLEVSPTFADSHRYLGQILLLRGQPREALKEMEAEESTSDRDVGLALAYHALGRRVESDAALARVKVSGGSLQPTNIAVVYAYRGEFRQAFDWLDRAVAARDITLVHTLELDPLLASLRADPRYSTLLRKMNLPRQTHPNAL
jgi:adenylate cyclase